MFSGHYSTGGKLRPVASGLENFSQNSCSSNNAAFCRNSVLLFVGDSFVSSDTFPSIIIIIIIIIVIM